MNLVARKNYSLGEQKVAGIVGGDNIHTLSTPINLDNISQCGLVMTNITVSPSWWQLFLGSIKSIFGGQIQSYDKVLAYGRAEVMQRLREQALGEGWSEIINVRVETSNGDEQGEGRPAKQDGNPRIPCIWHRNPVISVIYIGSPLGLEASRIKHEKDKSSGHYRSIFLGPYNSTVYF